MSTEVDMSSVMTFTNISKEKFIHAYAGKSYSFDPHESRAMPEFLCRHLAKHLARRILTQKSADEISANDAFKKAYMQKDETKIVGMIIGDKVHKPVPAILSEGEAIAARVAELNEMNGEMAKKDGIETPSDKTTSGYADKAEVIAALESHNPPILHDKRKSKESLEQLLVE